MHGKAQRDFRAPGPGVPADKRINQEDATYGERRKLK